MSGPNPPGPESFGEEPGGEAVDDEHTRDVTTDTGFSQAYSAPESEQFTSGPYVAADPALYDYDTYESAAEHDDQPPTPRWPWVVGVAAILAAVALVASVSLLVFPSLTSHQAAPTTTDPQAAAGAGRDHQDGGATTADIRGSAAPAADRDGHGHVGTRRPPARRLLLRRRPRRARRPPPRRALRRRRPPRPRRRARGRSPTR